MGMEAGIAELKNPRLSVRTDHHFGLEIIYELDVPRVALALAEQPDSAHWLMGKKRKEMKTNVKTNMKNPEVHFT
jgi:hypothetical protein